VAKELPVKKRPVKLEYYHESIYFVYMIT